MRVRWVYASAAMLLLISEILIALFVRDAFIRPYGGDILVTVLLCCLCRAVLLHRIPYLPSWVFFFAVCVELAQAAGIASLIPDGWTVLRVIVGSSFSVWDIVCYGAGCLLFWGTEILCFRYGKRVFCRQKTREI